MPTTKRSSADYIASQFLSAVIMGSSHPLIPSCCPAVFQGPCVCGADALPSSEAEAAVRNGSALPSSWKQLLTEFGIQAELQMHLGGLNCS